LIKEQRVLAYLRFLLERHKRTIAFLLVALAAAYANYLAFNAANNAKEAARSSNRAAANAQIAIKKVEMESRDRRDQICFQDERAHLREVNQLKRTYAYLVGLTPKQREQPLAKAIIRFLPQTEEDANTDEAPPFCDKPGVGLPEPDPVVPKRPAVLGGG